MARKKKAAEVKAGVKDYAVLLSPVITEKTAVSGDNKTRVVFRVDTRANKKEIKEAIERVFNVKVKSINTVNYMGKVKRTTSVIGRRAAFKKAYVVLQEGQSIQVVEGL
jgi:large subunit ribosomal protein L23